MLANYDQIRIINLPARADRRREMKGELRRLGLHDDPRVQFFEAIVPDSPGNWRSVGEHGVFLSHMAVLKAARAAGASLLILEDDCDFTEAARTSDWGIGSQIFYGGFKATDPLRRELSDIEGAHCMGFDRSVLAPLIAFLETMGASSSPAPIDGSYVEFRRANPSVRTHFSLPQVAIQRQSPSDITPGRFDRHRWSSLAAGLLRKLNRARHRRRKMLDGS